MVKVECYKVFDIIAPIVSGKNLIKQIIHFLNNQILGIIKTIYSLGEVSKMFHVFE